jgi:hypothetical protein
LIKRRPAIETRKFGVCKKYMSGQVMLVVNIIYVNAAGPKIVGIVAARSETAETTNSSIKPLGKAKTMETQGENS